MKPRTPTLTHAMIATRFPAPVIDDLGDHKFKTEAECDAQLDRILLAHDSGDLWVFGYGSLMWKPEMDFAETRPALLNGWHRRFCLWQYRWRGTLRNPGLMLALDRGGACRGMAFRLAAPDVRAKILTVWRREMIGNGYVPRWVKLKTMQGTLRGLVFVANIESERYAGRITDEIVADHMSRACGDAGSSADYLLQTVLKCEEFGIHDRFLWRLQELVAERMGGHAAADA